jgi:lipoate-protein ligase A
MLGFRDARLRDVRREVAARWRAPVRRRPGPLRPVMVRVVDTGVRGARENVALDQALIDAHLEGSAPDTIRFLRFRPSVLVGLHQFLAHEVRLDYCSGHGIEVGRRITGGGALYLDEGQLGWELLLDRRRFGAAGLDAIAAQLCAAAAGGLSRLGVPAKFRPRNDIECDGRKVGGTGGFIDGNTVFYQGTVLVDFDATRMIEALRIPVEKLAKRELDDARRRVISLRELLGGAPAMEVVREALLAGFREGLGLEAQRGSIAEREEEAAHRLHDTEIGTDAFVHGKPAPEAGDTLVSASLFARGGSMRADIRLEGTARERVREVLLTGDFFLSPPRALYDLEASLRGLPAHEAPAAAQAFFARSGCMLAGLEAADFGEAIARARAQVTIRAGGHLLRGHWRGPRHDAGPALVFLHDALGSTRQWRDVPERLAAATGLGAFVYDRHGSGDSEALSRPFRPDYLLAEALECLPQVLAHCGIREAILVGQSDGAAIALACAGAHPEMVRAVVALSPHLYREQKTLAAIRAQIVDFEQGDLRTRLQRHHGAKTQPLFERLVEAWTGTQASWGLEPYVARLRCPVLAIQGEDDEFFSSAQLDALAKLSPTTVALRLPGCGHYPHLQATRTVLTTVRRFLDRYCISPSELAQA